MTSAEPCICSGSCVIFPQTAIPRLVEHAFLTDWPRERLFLFGLLFAAFPQPFLRIWLVSIPDLEMLVCSPYPPLDALLEGYMALPEGLCYTSDEPGKAPFSGSRPRISSGKPEPRPRSRLKFMGCMGQIFFIYSAVLCVLIRTPGASAEVV